MHYAPLRRKIDLEIVPVSSLIRSPVRHVTRKSQLRVMAKESRPKADSRFYLPLRRHHRDTVCNEWYRLVTLLSGHGIWSTVQRSNLRVGDDFDIARRRLAEIFQRDVDERVLRDQV